MKIVRAKHAGFCFGVRRAIEAAERVAREGGGAPRICAASPGCAQRPRPTMIPEIEGNRSRMRAASAGEAMSPL